MPHIIISYRRADSDAIAGRIRDRLANHFGEDSVFMDIDSIPFGIDFREHIQQALSQNAVLVVVIGPKWLGPGKGGLRIMEETDPVRIEIETALKKRSTIIPVLVAGARMPKPSDLPDSLKDFSYRNAAEVNTGRDFHQHMERLIRSMDQVLGQTPRSPAEGTSDADKRIAAAPVAPVLGPVTAQAPIQAPIQAPAIAAMPEANDAALAAAAQSTAPAKRQGRTPWLIALLVCLVAGLGGGGAWLVLRSHEQAAPPKIAAPTPLPTTAEPRSPVRPIGVASAGCKLDAPATFADDFHGVDPAWLLPAQIAYYADGELALKAPEGKGSGVLYPPLRFENVTICARIKSPTQLGSLDGEAEAGVIFWAADLSNYYVATVFANGTYSIYRVANATWVPIIRRTPFESVKLGLGVVNEIRVAAKDNIGTLFINGHKVQEFRGQRPKDGSMIGLYGASSSSERNEWRVQNVAVADPDQPKQRMTAKAPAPQTGPDCKPLRKPAFEDNFKSADPGWHVAASTPAAFADGALVLRPKASQSWRELYPSLFYNNATVCGHIKSPPRLANVDGTASGGLIFWATNRNSYYTFSIYPNGRFDVYRMVKGVWAKIAPPTRSDSVKSGVGAINAIMVAFDGNMAAVHANGEKLFEFRGQPPQNGGSIGVYAASEEAAESEWRFVDVTVVEGE